MEDRDFNEVELRQMLIEASSYRENVIFDRWVIETRHRNSRWEIIVEPDGLRRRLVIITAYPVGT